jgi:hypothetical protein
MSFSFCHSGRIFWFRGVTGNNRVGMIACDHFQPSDSSRMTGVFAFYINAKAIGTGNLKAALQPQKNHNS